MLLQESVVSKCSKRTREAIENNDDITDVAVRRNVTKELLNETVAHMESIFGTDNPSMIKFLFPGTCL